MVSNDFRGSKDKAQLQCKTCKKQLRLSRHRYYPQNTPRHGLVVKALSERERNWHKLNLEIIPFSPRGFKSQFVNSLGFLHEGGLHRLEKLYTCEKTLIWLYLNAIHLYWMCFVKLFAF